MNEGNLKEHHAVIHKNGRYATQTLDSQLITIWDITNQAPPYTTRVTPPGMAYRDCDMRNVEWDPPLDEPTRQLLLSSGAQI
ncbi:MAG: hypothetical protein OHK0039_36170 [Bacteroidia bacterium]